MARPTSKTGSATGPGAEVAAGTGAPVDVVAPEAGRPRWATVVWEGLVPGLAFAGAPFAVWRWLHGGQGIDAAAAPMAAIAVAITLWHGWLAVSGRRAPATMWVRWAFVAGFDLMVVARLVVWAA